VKFRSLQEDEKKIFFFHKLFASCERGGRESEEFQSGVLQGQRLERVQSEVLQGQRRERVQSGVLQGKRWK
jgi:hypothetical protein